MAPKDSEATRVTVPLGAVYGAACASSASIEPGPAHRGQHRVGGHLGLDRGPDERDDAEGRRPRSRARPGRAAGRIARSPALRSSSSAVGDHVGGQGHGPGREPLGRGGLLQHDLGPETCGAQGLARAPERPPGRRPRAGRTMVVSVGRPGRRAGGAQRRRPCAVRGRPTALGSCGARPPRPALQRALGHGRLRRRPALAARPAFAVVACRTPVPSWRSSRGAWRSGAFDDPHGYLPWAVAAGLVGLCRSRSSTRRSPWAPWASCSRSPRPA